jgi:hypothetical protein
MMFMDDHRLCCYLPSLVYNHGNSEMKGHIPMTVGVRYRIICEALSFQYTPK